MLVAMGGAAAGRCWGASPCSPRIEDGTLTEADFSDLSGNLDLYNPANRRDGVHLNLAGADLFSRKLATRFAAHTQL